MEKAPGRAGPMIPISAVLGESLVAVVSYICSDALNTWPGHALLRS